MGRYSEAIEEYRQALIQGGESGEILFRLGRTLSHQQHWTEAIVEYRRAIALGFQQPQVHYYLGQALAQLGRWKHTVQEWKLVLDSYPGAATVRQQLAYILMGLGQWQDALLQWRQYVQIAPGSEAEHVVKSKLEWPIYGQIPHSKKLSLIEDLTIEFWLYLKQWPSGWTDIISKFIDDTNNEFCFRMKNENIGQFYHGNTTKVPVTWIPKEHIKLNQWTHIACVRKVGGYGRIYCNGVLISERNWTREPRAVNTKAPVQLMANPDQGKFHNGQLRQLRIWNIARSQEKILENLYKTLKHDTVGLVGSWCFPDLENKMWVDEIENNTAKISQVKISPEQNLKGAIFCSDLHTNLEIKLNEIIKSFPQSFNLVSFVTPELKEKISNKISQVKPNFEIIEYENSQSFLKRSISKVLESPYNVIYIHEPQISDIVLGIFYKIVWDAKVFYKATHKKAVTSKCKDIMDISTLLNSGTIFSDPKSWETQIWTNLAIALAEEFECIKENVSVKDHDYFGDDLVNSVIKMNGNFISKTTLVAAKSQPLSDLLQQLLKECSAMPSLLERFINNRTNLADDSMRKLVESNQINSNSQGEDHVTQTTVHSTQVTTVPSKVSINQYQLKIEIIDAYQIKGWCVNKLNTSDVLNIKVFVDNLLFKTIKNDVKRGDLERAGISDGSGGIKLNFPKGLFDKSEHKITLKIEDIEEGYSAIIYLNKKIEHNYEPIKKFTKNVTIIVPVYNAPDDVKVCIDRLIEYTTTPSKLLLIDDASTDPRINDILESVKQYKNIRVLRNSQNLGYTKTVNKGITESGDDDVVLLNSDARVTPRWLEGLRQAAESDPRIATVTAMSDRAGAFSAPNLGNENPLPASTTEIEYAIAFRRRSQRVYPSVPTGNGFCMYIRRTCIDEVGLFDEKAFPRGYCEENDFCMHARQLGWRHIIDDATYIFHSRSKSFGSNKTVLIKAGREIIDSRYPDYSKAIRVFSESAQINLARFRASQAQQDCISVSKILPRALFVVATRTGGTPQINQDLMEVLSDEWETWLFHCDGHKLSLIRFLKTTEEIIEEFTLSELIDPVSHRSFEYETVVSNWLRKYEFDLVHIRHLLWHSLALTQLSHESGAAVVFSFHDFYSLCPTTKLLDENNVFCNGHCTDTSGTCKPDFWSENSLPSLKHQWVYEWRNKFSTSLKWCDEFVTTSESVRSTILSVLPEIPPERFHIIPHGRDFQKFYQIQPELKVREPLKILVPGNISVAKGCDVIRDLLEQDKDAKLDIHVLGKMYRSYNHPRLTLHGEYTRDEFADCVLKIQPHVGAVFSIWNETWCHTLTEMWSVGLPVIAFEFPTVAQRVLKNGAGWICKHQNSENLYKEIISKVANTEELYQKRVAVITWQNTEGKINTKYKMSLGYKDIYSKAIPHCVYRKKHLCDT